MVKVKEYIRLPTPIIEVVMILTAAEIKLLRGLLQLPSETRESCRDYDKVTDNAIWVPFDKVYHEILRAEKEDC